MQETYTRRDVWLSMLAALGAGATGGYWASGIRVDELGSEEDWVHQVALAQPGALFWEGADPSVKGVRVLDVVHDLNNVMCRRLRPTLEALIRTSSNLALCWRDWPTEGKDSWNAAVVLRAIALLDRTEAIRLLHQSAIWEGQVTAQRFRSVWPRSLAKALLKMGEELVMADVAWAKGFGLPAPPFVLEDGKLLGVEALSVEQWRERLGLDSDS